MLALIHKIKEKPIGLNLNEAIKIRLVEQGTYAIALALQICSLFPRPLVRLSTAHCLRWATATRLALGACSSHIYMSFLFENLSCASPCHSLVIRCRAIYVRTMATSKQKQTRARRGSTKVRTGARMFHKASNQLKLYLI